MKYSNTTEIPLALAVWVLQDNYDYNNSPKTISVTTLLKPLKQAILGKRVDTTNLVMDIESLVPSSLGSTIHDGVERAWLDTKNYQRAMTKLGYSDDIISRVVVNPTEEDLTTDSLPIYVEQRVEKDIAGWTISGKYDTIMFGEIQDVKSTSAWSWVFGSNDQNYALQLSMYRWLNPKKVTQATGQINFVFTDHNKATAAQNTSYPTNRVMSKKITLLEPEAIEAWIKERLALLEKYAEAPEEALPECSDEDLWWSDVKYKYYKDATKTDGRSTKNFSSLAEANMHLATNGGVGVVLTVKTEPKRCGFCAAFTICKQKDKYFNV